MRNVLNIEVRKIEVRKIVIPEGRMRPINAAWVEKLRDSIKKRQLLLPLVVGVPNDDELWPLVDGAHRLATLKKLNGTLSFDKGQGGRVPTRRDRGESREVSPDQAASPPARGRGTAFARRDLWPNQERRGSRKSVHCWESGKTSR